MDNVIKCPECCVNKPWQDFLTKSGYRAKRCAQCRSYREASNRRPHVQDNKRLANIAWKYGLSREQQAAMVEAQGGLCAICPEPLTKYFVDHCHDTGVIRGLLCARCNTGLGFFKDSAEQLRKAAEYLEQNFIGRPYHKDFRNAQKSTD